MSVHKALLDAVITSVTLSVEKVAETALNPAANPEDMSPAMAAFIDLLSSLQQRLDAAHATIQTLTEALNGKASADSLTALRQRVTTAEGTLSQKADTSFVSQQVQAIANVDAEQAAAIHAFQVALSGDEGVLQTVLAKQSSHELLLGGLRTDVDAKAPQATVSSLSGQLTTLRNSVNDAGSGLAATKAVADAALPRAGGTMTGPLSVLAPTAAPNPLQMSSLPYSMTVQQPLPALALGGSTSFTVTVPNATVGQVVILNPNPTLAGSLTFYEALVTAADTVTIRLKAGLALLAGQQTFYLRVLR